MGVEHWQARWHAPQKPQEKRGFTRQIVRATSPKKWHALARSLPQREKELPLARRPTEPFVPGSSVGQHDRAIPVLAEPQLRLERCSQLLGQLGRVRSEEAVHTVGDLATQALAVRRGALRVAR